MSAQARREHPPKVKCSGTSKRSGERCKRWAVVGRFQCKHHGAFAGPGGRQVAEERAGAVITLAEMMANNPGRPVWEVIRDSIRTVDVIAQHAAQDVAAGRVTGSEGIERVVGYARQAHAMAASAVAAKALEMEAQAADRWGDLVAGRLVVLMDDWLGLPTGHAVTAAMRATLDVDLSNPSPAPRPDGPPLLALVGQAQAAALAPRLGLPAGELTAWLGRVADAVADGRPVPALPGAAVAALPPAPAPEPEPAPPVTAEPPSQDSKVAGWGDEEPEPQVNEPEPEIVDAELVDDPEPEVQPRRIFDEERRIYVRNPAYRPQAGGSDRATTTLGYQSPTQVTMPSSYRPFS